MRPTTAATASVVSVMRTPVSSRLKLASGCGWASGSLTPHGSASGAVFLPGLPGGDEGRAGDGDDTARAFGRAEPLPDDDPCEHYRDDRVERAEDGNDAGRAVRRRRGDEHVRSRVDEPDGDEHREQAPRRAEGPGRRECHERAQ